MAAFQRSLLRLFGALPMPVRRALVRTIRPSWTAGAVAIIERDDGRWLLVRPVYRKAWALPGGLIDRGEHPEETVRREMREELGVDVVIGPEPWVIYDSRLRRLDAVFRVRLADGIDPDAIEVTSVELLDAAWFDPDDPPVVEDEASDILMLRRRVIEGGDAVLLR